jgi:hypothetical protein
MSDNAQVCKPAELLCPITHTKNLRSLSASVNAIYLCLPERSAAIRCSSIRLMGAESKDPEDFYRTKVASGSSTNTLSGKNMP